ncbi:MAG: hypothetical protein AVDCRST_MAG27-4526, partial [uncultured Craurococcus sp.]
ASGLAGGDPEGARHDHPPCRRSRRPAARAFGAWALAGRRPGPRSLRRRAGRRRRRDDGGRDRSRGAGRLPPARPARRPAQAGAARHAAPRAGHAGASGAPGRGLRCGARDGWPAQGAVHDDARQRGGDARPRGRLCVRPAAAGGGSGEPAAPQRPPAAGRRLVDGCAAAAARARWQRVVPLAGPVAARRLGLHRRAGAGGLRPWPGEAGPARPRARRRLPQPGPHGAFRAGATRALDRRAAGGALAAERPRPRLWRPPRPRRLLRPRRHGRGPHPL